MSKRIVEKPDYGNWVPTKMIYIPGFACILFLGLSFLYPILMVGAAFSLLCLAYFSYAYYRFSPRGGSIQAKVNGMVLDRLDWDGQGRVLDIGCGNGPLAIGLAKKYPHARVAGMDYWGRGWEYSTRVCERNAEIEGVANRVTFRKGSAAALPFEDEAFDAAVSNLVFHDVGYAKNKKDLIREALRVVKKGGRFAFQDLFLIRMMFGEIDDLVETIRGWGVEHVEFVDTSGSKFIPTALKLPFMLGTIGILYGTK